MGVTMLKLCGRVGANREAYDLVRGWEATYGGRPSVIHYTCVMSGCLRQKNYDLAWAAYELMKTSGVVPDSTTFSTLLPAMVAAHCWDRALLAREALAGPAQHSVPAETLNSALAQMRAAEGHSRHAAELQKLMCSAGMPIAAPRRSQHGRPLQSGPRALA